MRVELFTPEQKKVYNVLLALGFSYEPDAWFDYRLESSRALNFIKVYPDYVYLKTYSKELAFADSGTIGPPLPTTRKLIEFIIMKEPLTTN